MTEDQANTCKIRAVEGYAACLKEIALLRDHLRLTGDILAETAGVLQAGEAPEQSINYPPSQDAQEDFEKLHERRAEKKALENTLSDFGLAALIHD